MPAGIYKGDANMIDLIKFTVKADAVEDAKRYMSIQAEENRHDEGHLMSHVFQSKTDPHAFYMLMGWENQQAVEKHMATEHDAQFREWMDSLLACEPEFVEWSQII